MVRIACIILLVLAWAAPSYALTSDCLAMAEHPQIQRASLSPAKLEQGQLQLTFIGHSTFLIESLGGVRIATDYAGYAGETVPDVVTMNHAHRSHYTDFPDPRIKHVLRGWNPDGGPIHHDLQIGDVRIRNVTTDIRFGGSNRIPDGNSIFIFEIAGLCIGHLGHLHHELSSTQLGLIGRLDVLLVPVDGSYTMAQAAMMRVVEELRARIVIPMHYFGPATLGRFIAGVNGILEVDMRGSPTLVVSSADLPEKPTLVVLPGH